MVSSVEIPSSSSVVKAADISLCFCETYSKNRRVDDPSFSNTRELYRSDPSIPRKIVQNVKSTESEDCMVHFHVHVQTWFVLTNLFAPPPHVSDPTQVSFDVVVYLLIFQ